MRPTVSFHWFNRVDLECTGVYLWVHGSLSEDPFVWEKNVGGPLVGPLGSIHA